MSPRPRKRGSKDLPSNLYINKKGANNYYSYRHPQTGERSGMGTNKIKAVEAARQLNQLLMQDNNLVEKVLKSEDAFAVYVEYYRDEILPAKRLKGFELSPSFMKEAVRRCTMCLLKNLAILACQR